MVYIGILKIKLQYHYQMKTGMNFYVIKGGEYSELDL